MQSRDDAPHPHPPQTFTMPKVRIPRPFAAIAFAAAVACNADPIVLCACSMPAPHTLVYGRVTAPTGEGVVGAAVHLEVGPPDCQTAGAAFSGFSDAGGRYRAAVFDVTDGTQQCVRVWALAPVGSGYRDSDTVTITLATPVSATADSVRRDVALRAP